MTACLSRTWTAFKEFAQQPETKVSLCLGAAGALTLLTPISLTAQLVHTAMQTSFFYIGMKGLLYDPASHLIPPAIAACSWAVSVISFGETKSFEFLKAFIAMALSSTLSLGGGIRIHRIQNPLRVGESLLPESVSEG